MELKELIEILEKYDKDGYSFHLGNPESYTQDSHFESTLEVVDLKIEATKIIK